MPILGGIKLYANGIVTLRISLYCIVWVGNIMTPILLAFFGVA